MSEQTGIDEELGYEPGEPLPWSELVENETQERKRRTSRFIAGPFPWVQFCMASRLPGKALAVWELLHHRKRVSQSTVVTLPNGLLEEAGINADAKSRALQSLEQAGLITVYRSSGRSPRVALKSHQDRR